MTPSTLSAIRSILGSHFSEARAKALYRVVLEGVREQGAEIAGILEPWALEHFYNGVDAEHDRNTGVDRSPDDIAAEIVALLVGPMEVVLSSAKQVAVKAPGMTP